MFFIFSLCFSFSVFGFFLGFCWDRVLGFRETLKVFDVVFGGRSFNVSLFGFLGF